MEKHTQIRPYDTHVPQKTAYLVRTALGRFYVKASCHCTGQKVTTVSLCGTNLELLGQVPRIVVFFYATECKKSQSVVQHENIFLACLFVCQRTTWT